MARKLRWTLDFKSLNNTGCHIDIYKEGYIGTTVTALVGAANSFEYEDDHETDLLHFVRYKTGYLRVVEQTYGDLAGLAPSSITAHYVVAKYGGVVVFTGYMQCVELSNDWTAGPRVLEFPVISPLGLLSAFNFTPLATPAMTTVGTLLQEVLNTLNPYVAGDATQQGYQKVMWPGDTYWPWDAKIHSLVMCPFNSEFKHWSTVTDLYSPRDFSYLIEGICACFGWMVHDTPEYVVFSQFDATGKHSEMAVADLDGPADRQDWNQDTYENEYYYQFSNNDSSYMVRRPLKSIDVSIEGNGIRRKALSTTHAVTYGTAEGGVGSQYGYRSVRMQQVGPDVDADHLGVPTIIGVGEISNLGTFPYACGFFDSDDKDVSLNDSWVIHYDSSWANGTVLVKSKFYGLIVANLQGYLLLKLQVEYGSTLSEMRTSGYNADININMEIKIGQKYYSIADQTLYDSQVLNAVTIDRNTGKIVPNVSLQNSNTNAYIYDTDGIIIKPSAGWEQYLYSSIEISLIKSNATSIYNAYYLRIADLSLNNPSEPLDDFVPDNYHKTLVSIDGNNTGTETAGLTANINNYIDCICEHSIMNVNNAITGSCPQYAYMFTPQIFVEAKVKKRRSSVPGPIEFTEKWIVTGTSGPLWRLIARSFCLWNDEYRVTFAKIP